MENKLSKAAKSSSNVYLPDEIIFEIQLRLPVKSLIRFCCVSKNWLSTIISDPKFGKSHFKLASQQKTLRRRFLITSPKETPPFGESHDIRSIPFPIRSTLRLHPITLGSCNGLVCLLYSGWDICLWNPTTNKVQSLPSPSHDLKGISIVFSGFGYVSHTDDYKLVIRSDLDGEYVVDIFSLRNKSWKRKMSTPFYGGAVVTCSFGNCVYSNLHWPVSLTGDRKSVLAFDLVEEKFRDLEVPFSDRAVEGDLSIGVISRGRCLCVTERNPKYIRLWAMIKYNVPASWTTLSIRLYIGPEFTDGVFFSESCIYVKQLIRRRTYLVRFDAEASKCRISRGFNMIQYEENLLQLDDYLRTN